MRIIRDTKWFNILQRGGSLTDCIESENTASQNWAMDTLRLAGGLAEIRRQKKQIQVIDIGRNDQDYSFIVRKESNPDESQREEK